VLVVVVVAVDDADALLEVDVVMVVQVS